MILRWFRSRFSAPSPPSPSALCLAALLAFFGWLPGASADSLTVTPVAEGVTLKTYVYDNLYGARMEVVVIVADLDHPAVGVRFNYRRGGANGDPYRPVPILASEVAKAVAAVNAQFFDLGGGTGSVQYQKVDGILINGPDSASDRQAVIVRSNGQAEVVWRPSSGWSSLFDIPNILASNDDLITNGVVRNVFPSGSHHTSRHPRTAAAWTYDNKLLLIVVDGRSTRSAGMTMTEWANYIAGLGNIRNAFNYDGGGSTTSWANGIVRNRPSDGSPRSVANAVVVTSDPLPSEDVIVDNPAATVVGSWQTGTSSSDRYGPDYRFKSRGDGSAYLEFTPTLPAAAAYEVFAMYPRGTNRTTAAPYEIHHAGGQTTVSVNQQVNGGVWVSLGVYAFAAGSGGSVRITDNIPESDKVVMADAIRWARPAPVATATTLAAASVLPGVVGQPERFDATVSGPAGALTGAVTFYNGVTELGTVELDPATRRASFTTSDLPVGSHRIEAVYNGNGAFAPSASVSLVKTIGTTGLCLPAPAGLVGWWPADYHPQDVASGITGAFNVPYATGFEGQAFLFDGSVEQSGTVSTSPVLNVDAGGAGITLAAWIRPEDTNTRPIVEYGTPANGTNQRGVWLWMGSGGVLEGNIRSTSGANFVYRTDPGTILPGVWQHVALTYDKTNGWMRLYRNGRVVYERNIGAYIGFRTQYPLGVGHRPNGSERFRGRIDELMLFDRAVTREEMTALVDSGVGACSWSNFPSGANYVAWAYQPTSAPVVSTPTVYDGRAYVVTSTGVLRALDVETGAEDAGFGAHILDGPVLGRPTVSFAGGAGRLYLVTRAGTLYVKDLETGLDALAPVPLLTDDQGQPRASESVSSPAVSETDSGLFAFAGVNDPAASRGYIARVNLATREVVALEIGTEVTSSPSVTRDGVTVQIGALDGAGGRLLSLQTSDFTARLALETPASQFKAPPVVSVVDGVPTLMIGDTGGVFYSYNAANGALRWMTGADDVPALDGGIDQTAWVDYGAQPNVVYVGTATGTVHALDAVSGAPADTPPFLTTGGALTGGPLLLDGDGRDVMYTPTVNGLFADRPGGTPARRFPVSPGGALFPGVRTPSATAAARGSIIVVTSGNGSVYGLVAQ